MWHTKDSGKYGWARHLMLIIALVTMVVLGGTAQAQEGETLSYGTSVSGALTAETPFAIYNVTMNAGDMISVTVLGLTPEMRPAIGMVGPDQLPISQSEDDPFNAAGAQLARLDYRAIQAGAYTLIVTNANSTAGEFALYLAGRPAPTSINLPLNALETTNLPPNAAPVAYSFPAEPDGNLRLRLNTNTPGFSFVARVYDGRGHLVAKLGGLDVRGAALDIGPGSGEYVVEIGALTPDMPGAIQIGLAPDSAPQPDSVSPTPQAPVATPTVCQVTSNNNVNVRSGPSTAYPAFGSLTPSTSLNVVGRNNITSWYVVDYNGRQGWVAGNVVEVSGPCGALPFVPDPPLPVTPTPLPTATPSTPTVSFTSTIGDGVTYPSGTCFTFYWTVTNVREVYFDGQGVSGQGQREACPTASRNYVLRVVYLDGTSQEFSIPVSITP